MRPVSDFEIECRIVRALSSDPLLAGHGVRATVRSGWAVLLGEVTRPLHRWAAEADIRCVPGVAGVENRIVVRG